MIDVRPEYLSWLADLPEPSRELAELLLARTPLIDVRAPVEFEQGAAPGAVNLPVLNDDERAAVGTTYKMQGQDEAIRLATGLVSGPVREARLDAWAAYAHAHPTARIYCFRGGLRSRSVQAALAEERGVRLPLIQHGYKRIRRFLIEIGDSLSAREDFVVVSGLTGAGKTTLLQELHASRRVCDLEAIARHRGSSFGKLKIRQPSQGQFENDLATDLLRLAADSRPGPIVLEDESRTIGVNVLPALFFQRLSQAPIFLLEEPIEHRARSLISVYIRENYGLQEGDRNPELLAELRRDLEASLTGIRQRLGGVEFTALSGMMAAAIADHAATGSFAAHQEWVERLLRCYYDPVYNRHLERVRDRVVARGSRDELLTRLNRI